MPRKPALGKGLDALLNAPGVDLPEGEQGWAIAEAISTDRIYASSVQPRSELDAESLEELARSIRSQGVMQPVMVRPRAEGGFELIAGERRWRAAQMADLKKVPAVVRDVNDAEAMTLALIENLQREDLNPMDEARALGRLTEEFGLTHEQVAGSVGKSRAAITNILRFLKLEPVVAELLRTGKIDSGHAKILLGVPGTPQVGLARKVARESLTVRALRSLVARRLRPRKRRSEKQSAHADPHLLQLERDLSDELATTVSVRPARGAAKTSRGELVIKYHSIEELNGFIARIGRRNH